MTNEAPTRKRWFQYSLRSLLFAMALLALLLTFVPKLYNWYYSIPLADAVARFNAQHANHPVGKFEPPLTEAEVVASIRAQLSRLKASGQVKSILTHIADSELLPSDAKLSMCDGFVSMDETIQFTVWWINLEVRASKNSGFMFSTFRIRENNAPVAKPKGEREFLPAESIHIRR